jgi:hypothetical protein
MTKKELASDDLLTTAEVATILRVKPKTVERERQRQRLGFVRIGKRGIRHTRGQVAEYVNNNRVDPLCKGDQPSGSVTSETSGSATIPSRRTSGASRDATKQHARLDAVRQAYAILKASTAQLTLSAAASKGSPHFDSRPPCVARLLRRRISASKGSHLCA